MARDDLLRDPEALDKVRRACVDGSHHVYVVVLRLNLHLVLDPLLAVRRVATRSERSTTSPALRCALCALCVECGASASGQTHTSLCQPTNHSKQQLLLENYALITATHEQQNIGRLADAIA